MEEKQGPTIDHIRQQQINDWLRQGDKLIREGRYLAADEFLQKVFGVAPDHELARSYQDRIEFLVKQLSQRVGLNKDVNSEIRQYRDRLMARKPKEIGSLLVSAQKYLDGGLYQKAEECIGRVVGLDNENLYAKSLLQRIKELQQKAGSAHVQTKQEFDFSSIVRESWRNGTPSASQKSLIVKAQHDFGVSDARRLELEREIRNALYLDDLRATWMTGGLAAFTNQTVDQLRSKFEISRIDHSVIEASLLREMRKNRIKGTILIVDGHEENLLELTQHLRSNFFAVFSASTVDEALASIKTAVPDIVISEVEFLDPAGGFDLFQTMRANPLTRHVPFIFSSEGIDRTTLLIGKRMGVEEFLPKPVDHELLLSTIEGKLLRMQKSTHRQSHGHGKD